MYNIFISHAWQYNEEYYRLVKSLRDNNFPFHNYSVPEHDPLGANTDRELEEALRCQIKPCSCVLIIAGMYYDYRKWLQIEIDIAQEYSKPIIVIRPWGAERIPIELQKPAFNIVNWQIKSIIEAIEWYS